MPFKTLSCVNGCDTLILKGSIATLSISERECKGEGGNIKQGSSLTQKSDANLCICLFQASTESDQEHPRENVPLALYLEMSDNKETIR